MKVKFTSLSWLHSEKEEDILFWNLFSTNYVAI